MPLPSPVGISAVPMKLPGWMASIFTGLATVTVQAGASWMTCFPVGVSTLSVVSVAVSTLPRMTVGAAGPWAMTAVAERARAALSARRVFFITLDCEPWRRVNARAAVLRSGPAPP